MRWGTVRPLEGVIAVIALLTLTFFASQWVMEAGVHSRKTQTVPDIKGKSLSAALDMLAPLNLGIKKEASEFASGVAVSAILRQIPPAGTVVREGKIVKVVVSQGGETVFAPNVSGLPLRNAEMMLRQSQLILGEVTESYSLRLDKGMVLTQEPKEESSVERGSLVNVVVSGGAPPSGILLMPDFLRKNVNEATGWAMNSGVSVAVSTDASSLFPTGVILTQTPPADSVLSQDSKITLTVSGRPSQSRIESATNKTFHYELAQGGAESLVRIVVIDKYGERELFNGLRRPGSKIDLPIQETGGARVKIFLNGILVEERDL